MELPRKIYKKVWDHFESVMVSVPLIFIKYVIRPIEHFGEVGTLINRELQ